MVLFYYCFTKIPFLLYTPVNESCAIIEIQGHDISAGGQETKLILLCKVVLRSWHPAWRGEN